MYKPLLGEFPDPRVVRRIQIQHAGIVKKLPAPQAHISGYPFIPFWMLADIGAVLGRHSISMSTVIQKPQRCEDFVPLVLLTHRAREKDLQAALSEISELACTRLPNVCIRVDTDL